MPSKICAGRKQKSNPLKRPARSTPSCSWRTASRRSSAQIPSATRLESASPARSARAPCRASEAGAALCVNVGMCHERRGFGVESGQHHHSPRCLSLWRLCRKDLPGLAHFLEHMLFTGTAKYPKEGQGGRCEAVRLPQEIMPFGRVCTGISLKDLGAEQAWLSKRKSCANGATHSGDYHEFIQQNGGLANAYTACYFTNYMQDAQNLSSNSEFPIAGPGSSAFPDWATSEGDLRVPMAGDKALFQLAGDLFWF